ncbi:hypothetical protein [Ralstonia insidiosa]|uniref:hypothetical protein n=1 Tax=Ralstonia insidiosa TaxID=190721 RepID=UPI000CEF171B|nr:hypothetical protein [Ralstonia insidiosa]
MIKYTRPPAMPKGLLRAGREELAFNLKAIQAKTKLKFQAYSSDEVKKELKALFGRKCVFCESLLMGTQPGDVEHFRPKGAVAVPSAGGGKPTKKPGYYWLAATWSNLLLACTDCNRPRTQEDVDGQNRVIGKAKYFPLVHERARATTGAMLAGEAPLLLDPCRDNPENHLTFLDDGRVEAAKIGGTPSPKGHATIFYCGLARVELLQMRARHRRLVMAAVRHIKRAIGAGEDPGADLDDLVQMLHPHEPYVAYTRELVRLHLSDFLEDLLLGV